MCPAWAPPHLLLFDHPAADHLVDRGFGQGAGDRLSGVVTEYARKGPRPGGAPGQGQFEASAAGVARGWPVLVVIWLECRVGVDRSDRLSLPGLILLITAVRIPRSPSGSHWSSRITGMPRSEFPQVVTFRAIWRGIFSGKWRNVVAMGPEFDWLRGSGQRMSVSADGHYLGDR